MMMGLQADHFFLIDVIPVAPGVTRERFDIFFFGEEAMDEAHRAIRERTIERWDGVFSKEQGKNEKAPLRGVLGFGFHRGGCCGGRYGPRRRSPAHAPCR
jgi:hypothetical protein